MTVQGVADMSTAAQFVDELRKLKARSGLSYRGIERAARRLGDVLPASTVASALNRDSFPSADFVRALVRACGGSEEDVSSWTGIHRTAAEMQAVRATSTNEPIAPAQPSGITPAPPCLLPAKPPRLLGRAHDSDRVEATLTGSREGSRIMIIAGPAGVGKTTFAVHTAHRIKAHFPDGQLYAPLRGATDQPADPSTVMSGFLRAIGVAGTAVPSDHTERLHLYRTLTARRRILVVLDDAANARQVRELIPTGEACAVIVTSRTSLADLDGNRHPLAVLSTDDAVELLADMVGAERVDTQPDVARSIVERCDRLPLAVWIAGARLAARPHLTLAGMADALNDTQRRLDALAVGDVAVRASLELTYRGLPPPVQRVFRLLSLPPTDFSTWTAAALLDTTLDQAAQHLDELVEVHLLEATDGNRFRMHDLVRAFAAERCGSEEDAVARTGAHERMLGAALHLTLTGGFRLSTDFQGLTSHPVTHWRLPPHHVDQLLADPLDWFDRERRLLILITEDGLRSAASLLATCLATSLTSFLQIRCLFDDWMRLQSTALDTAVAAGDTHTAAKLHRCLGELNTIIDRYHEAVTHFEQALIHGSPDDDSDSLASSLAGLAYVYRLQGRYREAAEHFSQAVEVAQKTDNRNCIIYATNGAGTTAFEQGDLATARARFEHALQLSQDSAYRPGQAQALRSLGMLRRHATDYTGAADYLEQARQISLGLGDRLAAAHAACWLGDVMVRDGRAGQGHRVLIESLWTFREFSNVWGEAATLTLLADAELSAGNPHAALVRAKDALDIWHKIASPYWLAIGLTALSQAHSACGNHDDAAHAAGEAARLHRDRPPGADVSEDSST